ncbi:hypothetical protein G6F68_015056 [Rhizopus microsporus]|nr:hypothetical protein G6F68_015056 [Rhizopus microsporus]
MAAGCGSGVPHHPALERGHRRPEPDRQLPGSIQQRYPLLRQPAVLPHGPGSAGGWPAVPGQPVVKPATGPHSRRAAGLVAPPGIGLDHAAILAMQPSLSCSSSVTLVPNQSADFT